MTSTRTPARSAGAFAAAFLTASFAATPLAAQRTTAEGRPAPTIGAAAPGTEATAFRVCGDPDNLPFSNDKREGFENKIAELIARDLKKPVEYQWWPHRRGFVRNTLRAKDCDVVIGVPGGFDPVAATKPYYRSTYYIVSRADRRPAVTSIDDPKLKSMKVGVHVIGNDYENTPPAHALGTRGIRAVGFNAFYGAGSGNKPEDIINAVVDSTIDVAVVWGPLAGYYAKQAKVPLTLTPLPDSDATSATRLPFAYNITMGVRRADKAFRLQLDSILDRRSPEIARILQEYGIPTRPIVAPQGS
jgi:quinoprotein dehydrogenase-associated probable ABC transporter substrate-binding protein